MAGGPAGLGRALSQEAQDFLEDVYLAAETTFSYAIPSVGDTIVVEDINNGEAFDIGSTWVHVALADGDANWEGVVTKVDGADVTFYVARVEGTGTFDSWAARRTAPPGTFIKGGIINLVGLTQYQIPIPTGVEQLFISAVELSHNAGSSRRIQLCAIATGATLLDTAGSYNAAGSSTQPAAITGSTNMLGNANIGATQSLSFTCVVQGLTSFKKSTLVMPFTASWKDTTGTAANSGSWNGFITRGDITDFIVLIPTSGTFDGNSALFYSYK